MPTSILLVDDDLTVRRVVAAHLRKQGYDVVAASGVDEAIMTLSGRHVQIVVTDIEMPGKDGYEMLRLLREHYPLIRPIVLTSHDSLNTVLEVLKLGAFSFVSKPIDDLGALDQAVAQAEEVLHGWLERLHGVARRRKSSTAIRRPGGAP